MRSFLPQFAASAIGLILAVSTVTAQTPPAPPKPASLPPATPPPAPAPFIAKFTLVRYDLPLAHSDGFAPTRQAAKLKDDADAIAWPSFTLNNKPIFKDKNEEDIPLKLRNGAEASSPFQLPTDEVIQPGNHWLRAMEWRRGLRHLYTADAAARTSNTGVNMNGRYELWLFPVLLQGEGGPVIKNVEVKIGNASIYKQPGPWRSLTLLLPQNEANKPYILTVDGRPPITFSVGLQPVRLGRPVAGVLPVKAQVAGDGPKISVRHLDRPGEFPNAKEWAADVAAMTKALPAAPAFDRGRGLQRYLGIEVPVSPLTIYASALPHGMSGGFFKKGADAKAYAQLLSQLGYDTVFDPVTNLPIPADAESIEKRAAVLASKGIRLGLNYDHSWTRPSFQHPNLSFFAHTLPDWHAPLYRSLSLTAQRFVRLPNFAGVQIGSDNAGYAAHWSWAPPAPDRPWGEAMIAFTGSTQPRVPRAPTLGPPELPYEQAVKTQQEFTKYAERYEVAFQQYGYFAEAVREVSPRLTFTSGSFGSAPNNNGRGGWPSASIPGREMNEGLPIQQAFDSNETHAAKPLHCLALVDRIHSYFPKKPTWALLDNHHFLYGREAWQRAYALLLTRGIQGVGTNFIAKPDGEGARPDVIAAQSEMNAWMRKYGAVYARSEPEATIGIFYGQLQAVQRKILAGENVKPDALLKGSHEGKVAEALFLCHAAGFPARIITYQEIFRGPLPASMQAILLVGLDQPDPSWNWGTGLIPTLQRFLDRGGRILTDEESVSPVASTKTGMNVAAYVPQMDVDATPMLLARNGENIEKLRAALSGIDVPLAKSDSETVWAIPTNCADTQYVTVVNQACAEGEEAKERLLPADPKATKPELWKFKGNASLYVKPQTGALQWNTSRPIYDVRLARKLTAEEAASVDLTKDGFRWYALPPAEIVAPQITVEKGVSGYYEARVKIPGAQRMSGIPVSITVTGPADSATVYSLTDTPTRLPLRDNDNGEYTITGRELLTNLEASTKVANQTTASTVSPRAQVIIRDTAALGKFGMRKKPLTIALTPEQEKVPTLTAHVKALKAYYEKKGRAVAVSTVKPDAVVESLQPLKSPHRYPQWKTIPSDLILFGTPANNVLLYDQARGEIFPRNFSAPETTEAALLYTRSPFVGEFDALNIIATDEAGFAAAVQKITSAP